MDFLDKLPKIFPFNQHNSSAEVYFALNIEAEKVTAAVWGIEGRRLTIISSAETAYSSEEELIDTANLSLDEALADFQPEPSKILFGVPDNWLQDDNLKPEFLGLLKKLVKELDLTPMAYVSSTHAITHGLQKTQGVPVTAVLVKIADPLEVTVVKAGKILGTKIQKRGANLPQDIEKALLSFTDVEVLPSKILVYGSEEIEKYKDELTSFSWMSQLPFLHLPKIEELEKNIAIKGVCYAGATEMNPDVIFPIYPVQVIKTGPIDRNYTAKRRMVMPLAGGIQDEHPDIAADEDYPEDLKEQQHAIGSKLAPILAPLTALMAKLPVPNIPIIKNNPLLGRKSFLIPLGVIVLFLLAYIFLPKAKVTAFLDLRVLEKDSQVTADPAITSVDESAKKIPGKVVEVQVSGSGTGSATGSKEVGDPAKGTVVVYNKTDAAKTFSVGTVLTGPNSLKFKIDTGVTVASESAVEGGISYGKTTVNATAVEIGPDGNLAAGKELTVGGESSSNFSAKVDQAFSGGVSKKVTVVTESDQKKLLAQVLSDLRNKARDKAQAKLTEDYNASHKKAGDEIADDYKILPEALVENVLKQSYSKKINDQANEFSLDLTVDFKGTAYKEADLKSIVSKLVATNIPDGYELNLSQTETQSEVAKVEKDGKLIFLAKFKAKLMPKIDQNKIKKELVAKTPSQAQDYLKNIPNVIGSNIELTPSLPGPLQRLPVLSRNITVEVTAK